MQQSTIIDGANSVRVVPALILFRAQGDKSPTSEIPVVRFGQKKLSPSVSGFFHDDNSALCCKFILSFFRASTKTLLRRRMNPIVRVPLLTQALTTKSRF